MGFGGVLREISLSAGQRPEEEMFGLESGPRGRHTRVTREGLFVKMEWFAMRLVKPGFIPLVVTCADTFSSRMSCFQLSVKAIEI